MMLSDWIEAYKTEDGTAYHVPDYKMSRIFKLELLNSYHCDEWQSGLLKIKTLEQQVKDYQEFREAQTSKVRELENELSQANNRIMSLKVNFNVTDSRATQLEKKLGVAIKALEFYGFENSWLGINDNLDKYLGPVKWVRIVEDDMDSNDLAGRLAREALSTIKGMEVGSDNG